MTRLKRTSIILSACLFFSTPAFADLVWPALYLETRLFSWWAILLGLAIEYVFIRSFLKLDIVRSLKITIIMNIASSLLGLIFIPLAGVLWEFFPGIIIYEVFDIGTFNPGTWTATFIMAVMINAAIESLVITKGFKTKIGKKGFWLLCFVNALSVAVAFISLAVYEVRL